MLVPRSNPNDSEANCLLWFSRLIHVYEVAPFLKVNRNPWALGPFCWMIDAVRNPTLPFQFLPTLLSVLVLRA
jgi:hypothetical protein